MTDIESLPLLSQKDKITYSTKKHKIYLVTLVTLLFGSILLYDIAGQRNSKWFLGYTLDITDLCDQLGESLESPVQFKGRLVRGNKAAVAVESEQCSNVGLDSKCTIRSIHNYFA